MGHLQYKRWLNGFRDARGSGIHPWKSPAWGEFPVWHFPAALQEGGMVVWVGSVGLCPSSRAGHQIPVLILIPSSAQGTATAEIPALELLLPGIMAEGVLQHSWAGKTQPAPASWCSAAGMAPGAALHGAFQREGFAAEHFGVVGGKNSKEQHRSCRGDSRAPSRLGHVHKIIRESQDGLDWEGP